MARWGFVFHGLTPMATSFRHFVAVHSGRLAAVHSGRLVAARSARHFGAAHSGRLVVGTLVATLWLVAG